MIEQVIPHLLGGISTQPAYLRGLTECENQVNCLPSLSQGLMKRPPSFHRALLSESRCNNPFTTFLDVDGERYILMIEEERLHLWNYEGRKVFSTQSHPYLQGIRFALITVGDKTYILNKDKVVKMSSRRGEDRPYEALVFVKQAIAQITYQLFIEYNGEQITSTITTAAQERSTSHIAELLKNDLAGKLPDIFRFDLQGSTFRISCASRNFKISAKDGYGDQALEAFKDTTQNFHNLPAKAFPGFTLEIATDPETKQDSFYVTYKDTGVWKETVKPGLKNKFDASTLPHILKKERNGAFSFGREKWQKRQVGDEETCPPPSFVGSPLEDIFFYKNRLGFLSQDNLVLSEVDEYTNFWPTTTATVLESDTIDIAIPYQRRVDLKYAVPLTTGNLLLLTPTDQYLVKGEDILTPRTIRADILSAFPCLDIKPLISPQGVIFATPQGLRELVMNEENRAKSEELTQHIKGLIRYPLKKMVFLHDTLFVLTHDPTAPLYVYTCHLQDDHRIQSAWSLWQFAAPLLDIETHNQSLFLLVKGEEGIHLEEINLTADSPLHLDRQVQLSYGFYNPNTRQTSWSVPYRTNQPLTIVPKEEERTVFQSAAEYGIIFLNGDYSQKSIAVGLAYEMKYTFSPFILKEAGHHGSVVPEPGGRVFLRYLSITFQNTGEFDVEVEQKGLKTGKSSFIPGRFPREPLGVFRIPLMGSNHDLKVTFKSTSLDTCCLQSAAWTALYVNPARRV